MSDREALDNGLEAPGADGLLGRRALVIGAETATGQSIARALGEAGADVALAVLRPDEGVLIARRLQRELRDRGRRALTYAMDVTLGRNVQVTTRQIAKELGGLDLVVSAPDEAFLAPLAQTSDAQLAQTMTVNGYAHAFAARSAFDEFRRQGEGPRAFILVTHTLGERGEAGAVATSMAAGAALALLRALTREHAGGDRAAVGLLRGASLPGDAATVADLGDALAAADAAEADPLGRLACAIATATAADVHGRVFSAGDAAALTAPLAAGASGTP